jgi:hypothetical protein
MTTLAAANLAAVNLAAVDLAAVNLAAVASIDQVLDNLRNWLIGILGGLATVLFTIGGARRLMSGGDPAEIERSNAAFRSAAFGYALAVLAPLIVQILKSIVGG